MIEDDAQADAQSGAEGDGARSRLHESCDCCQASPSEIALVPSSRQTRRAADRAEYKQDDAERASPVDGIEKRAARRRGAARGHREVLTALRPIDQREHGGGNRQPPRRRPRLRQTRKTRSTARIPPAASVAQSASTRYGPKALPIHGCLGAFSASVVRSFRGSFFRLAYSTRLGGGSASLLAPVSIALGSTCSLMLTSMNAGDSLRCLRSARISGSGSRMR